MRVLGASLLGVWLVLQPVRTAAQGLVSIVSSADGRAEVFMANAGPQGGVFHSYQRSAGTTTDWTGWATIGPAPTGMSALSAGRDGGGRIAAGWLNAGSIVVAGAPAPLAALNAAHRLDTNGLRSLAMAANADGRLEFLALDDAGRLWSVAQTSPGSWQTMNTHFLEGRDLKQIAVTPYKDGRLAVVALGGDGRVYWLSQKAPNAGWGDWQGLNGTDIRGVAAGANADGRLEVVAIGGDGHLWRQNETREGGWSGWSFLVGGPFKGAPVLTRNEDGRLEAFAVNAADRRVYHIWQKAPDGSWRDASERVGSGDDVDDAAATRPTDGRLVLVVRNDTACTAEVWTQQVANGFFVRGAALPRACPLPPPTITISRFEASRTYINNGESSSLTWDLSRNASCNPFTVSLTSQIWMSPEAFIPVNLGTVDHGPVTVSPREATDYFLTVGCKGTSVSDRKKVTVTLAPTPVSQALVAFAIGPFLTPNFPKQGEKFSASVLVRNYGNATSQEFDVEFWVDGVRVHTEHGTALASNALKSFSFDVSPLTGPFHELEWKIPQTGQLLGITLPTFD